MLSKEEIVRLADVYQSETGWDNKSRMSYITGAHVATKEAWNDVNNLLIALEYLYDEQNGPPLERRSIQWRLAYDLAGHMLKMFSRKPENPPQDSDGWIAVSERLPLPDNKFNESGWVLLFTPDCPQWVGWYNHEKKQWDSDARTPTHWRELPGKPQ